MAARIMLEHGPSLEDIELIGGYLARRDIPSLSRSAIDRPFDVLVLCGSAVLESVQVAATAYHAGLVGRLLITGGIGHSTPHLVQAVQGHAQYADVATRSRPEAVVLADILRCHHAVPSTAMCVETESTNCGENAKLSIRLLAECAGRPSIVLVQDPTMQRRTHAAFERHGHGLRRSGWLTSYAPLIPSVGVSVAPPGGPLGDAAWDFQRFTSLALGEIRRLYDDADGYGPRGANYIDHVDVPDDVLAAYRRVRRSVEGTLDR